MPLYNYKFFLKIMLLSGFFAINNLTVVAMQEPEATSENAAVDEVVNNLKQENDSTTENSKIIEDNKPVNLEPIATAQNQEVTTDTADTEASTNIDATDSKDEATKPVNDEIASTQANKDTNNEQANDNNQQDNKILIKNSYISINPGDNAAAYITVQNQNDEQIRLSEVSTANSDAVAKIEIHDNRTINKVIKMVHKKNGFKIKANSELKLKEGGKHIMLFGINKELFATSKSIDLILKFIKKDKTIIEIIHNFNVKEFKCKKCCSN